MTLARSARVVYLGVAGEQLVGNVGVILTGEAFADAVLHQAGQAGQNADGRINALLVQVAVQHDLSLR